jgi:hypothetical protein
MASRPDPFSLSRSDLNAFLFAEIGIEPSGMPLSVVSMLARLGDDPWSEAGRLAELPRADGADRLAHTIAGLPQNLWPFPEASTIATRLIALLPARPADPAPVRTAIDPGRARAVGAGVLVACIAIGAAFTFGTLLHRNPTRLDADSAVMASPIAAPGEPAAGVRPH